MQRAWSQGKRIGRPSVTTQPGFTDQLSAILEIMESEALSRRQAAKALGIGYATLKRILDAQTEMEPLTESLNS
jgi:DNA invertase Pin-like site-specific DNA recombinase